MGIGDLAGKVYDYGVKGDKKYTRSFLGIPLPDELKEDFLGLLRKIKRIDPSLHLVDAETAHILLAFLGDQEEEVLIQIAKEIEGELSKFRNIFIEVGGSGLFSNDDNEVYFLKVKGLDKAEESVRVIRKILEKYYDEGREFVPHLTVARGKTTADVLKEINKILGGVQWSFQISELAIYGAEEGEGKKNHKKVIELPV